jgi:hypothetical protein
MPHTEPQIEPFEEPVADDGLRFDLTQDQLNQIIQRAVEQGARLRPHAHPSQPTPSQPAPVVEPTEPGAQPVEETVVDEVAGAGVGEEQGVLPDLQILSSPTLQWFRDPATGLYYASYSLESGRQLIFEATPEQMDAIFGTGVRPSSAVTAFATLTQQEGVTFGGDITEVAMEGSFEAEVQRVVTLALDEGKLPSWMAGSAAAFDIVYIAQAEGKSVDWMIEQFEKLPEFKARFPGIQNFKDLNMNVTEAVGAFLEYEAGVKALARSYGIDEAQVTPELVGALAGKGYDLKTVELSFTTFRRMDQFAPALDAFNEILVAEGRQPLGSSEMFDFLSGNAPAELYDIYEAAAFREGAVQAGFGGTFGVDEAIKAALASPGFTSVEQAYQATQQIAQVALRFRNELDLGLYGLDIEDLIDMSLGLAPRSGVSQTEINENLQRAFEQARASRQNRLSRPFIGFTPSGRPQALSFGELQQER